MSRDHSILPVLTPQPDRVPAPLYGRVAKTPERANVLNPLPLASFPESMSSPSNPMK